MDRYNANEALNVQLGQAGSDYVTNETVNTIPITINTISVDFIILL